MSEMTDNVLAFVDPACRQGEPVPLLAPPAAPVLAASSPHVLSFDELAARFGTSERRRTLLTLVRVELEQLRAQGIVPVCLLVGGSFVRDGAAPNDLDALVVYQIAAGGMTEALYALRDRRSAGLDLRFVPGDAGPLPLVKMACFFHTLYQSRDRGGDQASFLVPLDR